MHYNLFFLFLFTGILNTRNEINVDSPNIQPSTYHSLHTNDESYQSNISQIPDIGNSFLENVNIYLKNYMLKAVNTDGDSNDFIHAINVHNSHNQREIISVKSFREDVRQWLLHKLKSDCIIGSRNIKFAMESAICSKKQKDPSLKVDEIKYLNDIVNNDTDFDYLMIHAACNILGVVIRKYMFYDNDEFDLTCYIPVSGIFEDIISIVHQGLHQCYGTISLLDQFTKDIVLQTCTDSYGYYDADKYIEAIQHAKSISNFVNLFHIE